MFRDVEALIALHFHAVNFGHSNPDRWSEMFDVLAAAGLVSGRFEYLNFVFDPAARDAQSLDRLFAVLAVALIAAMILAVLAWSWTLRKQVAARTGELAESEERFALAVEGTDAGIWDWKVKTGLVYRSPRFFRMLGYAEGELAQDAATSLDLIHPDDLAVTRKALDQHLGERVPYDAEVRMRHRLGHYIWVEARGQAVWDDDGEPIRMAGSVTDITDRVEAIVELRAAKARLCATIKQAGEAIITIDERQDIQVFNRAAEDLFGFSEDAAQQMNLDDLIPELHRAAHRRHVAKFLGSSEGIQSMNVPGEISGLRKDGSEFPAEATISTFMANGTRLGTVMIRDISERKRWEHQLRAAMEEAQFANRSKTEFLANTSHELRTPMNAIIGFSEMLMAGIAGEPTPQQTEYFKDIHGSALHLLGVINDILDLSRIEADVTKLDESVVDILKVVRSPMRIVAERAARGKLTLLNQVPDNFPKLQADKRIVKQILINLLSNAVKFTRAGGTVTVGAHVFHDRSIEIWVSDTGIGMDKRDFTKAVTAFGQIDGDLNRKFEGTGLGLSLVKSQLAAHGGELLISSDPGHGTTMTARFPPERTIESRRGPESHQRRTPPEVNDILPEQPTAKTGAG